MKQTTVLPKAQALLHEIYGALQRLQETGQSWTIYLNKMLLSQAERLWISEVLGRGNITITSQRGVQPSEWVESGIPGVWFGAYFDSRGGPLLETLEITFYPAHASAQIEDIATSLHTLQMRMQEGLGAG